MRPFHRDVTFPAATLPGASRIASARWTAGAALIAAIGMPGTGHALGLGRLVGEAVLGEVLQFEIPLIGSVERTLDTSCVTLRRPPDSIDAEYFPRDLKARVDIHPGNPRLVLESGSALRQPLVEFRLSITCGYNLSHDYLLMASPRSERPPAAAGVPATPARTPAATPATTAAPAAPESAATPDGIPSRTITLEGDITLEELARRYFPGPLRRERFMRWVVEANPQSFAGVADVRRHRLPAGQQLLIPAGVPPRRPGDHQTTAPAREARGGDGAPPAAAGKPTEPATGDKGLAPPAVKGRQDRLVVGGAAAGPRDFKETLALVERLTAMLEQQVAAQSTNDERIRKLEGSLADLSKYVVQLETTARQREAQWQAEREAERKAQAERAELGWWQLLLAVIVGGGVGAALLQGYRTLAGRGREAPFAAATPAPERPAAAAQVPVPVAVPAGWDDDLAPAAELPRGSAAAALGQIAAPRPVAAPEPAFATLQRIREEPRRSRHDELDFPLEFEPPAAPARAEPASVLAQAQSEEASDPAHAAIELANIMTSMGLAQSAAQTLVEHIRENPRQSLQHWLKLLELHRLNGNREGFETSAQELHEHFNVQPADWDSSAGAAARNSIEAYPHIRSQLVRLWRKADCMTFLQALLMDNRDGTRVGFPLAVAEEIVLLIAIQSAAA